MQAAGWTAQRDGVLRRLRAAGAGWPEIGKVLEVSADVARERGRRIGATWARAQVQPAPDDPDLSDPAREPLPAGHPLAWSLLTRGTLLHGSDWPGYGELECAA